MASSPDKEMLEEVKANNSTMNDSQKLQTESEPINIINNSDFESIKRKGLSGNHPNVDFRSNGTNHTLTSPEPDKQQINNSDSDSIELEDEKEDDSRNLETKFAQSVAIPRASFACTKNTTTSKKEEEQSAYNFLDLAKSKDSASLLNNMSFDVDISKLYTVLASACSN